LDVEAGFDIAQAFTPRQLSKRIAALIHKLRKNMMACVHRLLHGNAADVRKRRKNFKSITVKKSVLSSHINQLHSLRPTTLGH
jgi:hypothetical protein